VPSRTIDLAFVGASSVSVACGASKARENDRELSELIDLARPWVVPAQEEALRDLILKMSISIDGFVGGPDGGINRVFDSGQEATAWTAPSTTWPPIGRPPPKCSRRR
jgi:hypothetical protein